MPLTEAAIRAARPHEKPYKLFDGGGLYLLVTPEGGRWWRLKYRYGGKERGLSLGVYPAVSLRTARERRDEARRLLASGVDPSAHRKAERASRAETFEALAREWLALQQPTLAPATYAKARWLLEAFLLPKLGDRPIHEITPPELLGVLRGIESGGIHETAHRAKQLAGRIFRYAIATGRAERDPAADLRGALAPIAARNHAAITEPAKVGALLRVIDGYVGQPATMYALRLAPLVFVRPGELRAAEWREFDLEAAEWRIPAERMKMREAHLVPLSRQAVAILKELHAFTGTGRYLFPSLRTPARPISENTLNAALRRLGYAKDEMTAHGFRAMASTLLNERGFPPDVIELQLAHAERNRVRAAYNRAERLDERRQMMQAWADYLDSLRSGARVVTLRQAPGT
ncbi:MAG: integrase arm-type DNA-binding domain-containing protein [Steroidobacteraceae bacterium]|nr:integrase arm-type DNA-binding domain-containing protein [Steroidobacteraceae bacterium]